MPQDPTPFARQAMQELPERAQIPQPKPGATNEDSHRVDPAAAADPAQPPSREDHPSAISKDADDRGG